MTYDTVDDVFATNEAVRRRLLARVEGLEEARANASEGGWTVAQIVEHLSIAEPRITNAIEGMLAATEGDSGERKTFAPGTGLTGLPLAEGLTRLKESRASLEALRPRFQSADYSRLLKHPAFGMLNAGQWLAFLGMHEQRHLRQIERILGER